MDYSIKGPLAPVEVAYEGRRRLEKLVAGDDELGAGYLKGDTTSTSTIGLKLANRDQRKNARLVAALSYLFTPLVPIAVLTTELKLNTYLRRHAVQALLWSSVFILLLAIDIVLMIALIRSNFLYILVLPFALAIPFIPGAIWARSIYLGRDVSVPLFGRFVKR